MKGVEFPALGQLLLSATGLVNLLLCEISDSVFINPKTMADWLPSLTGLVKLQIEYRFVRPVTRIVLPVLTTLAFKGGSKSLDLLFSHLDTPRGPRLKQVDMDFACPPTFAFSKVSQLISCMESFEAFDQVHMLGLDYSEVVSVWLSSQKRTTDGGMWLKRSMSWEADSDVWQLESLAQVHHPLAQPLATHGCFDSDFLLSREFCTRSRHPDDPDATQLQYPLEYSARCANIMTWTA